MRLPACLFYCLLVAVSFKLAGGHDERIWLYVASALFISCAAMVQNDWRDRYNDLKKGKTLATDWPKKYLILVLVVWALAIAAAFAVTFWSIKPSLIPWSMVLVGIIYSETRKIFMLPTVLIACTAASSVLFPVLEGRWLLSVWMLFASMFLASLAHEIVKDLEDLTVDVGYKNTLPQKTGAKWSEIVAGILMILSFVPMSFISPIVLLGLPFCAISYHYLFRRRAYLTAKRYFDGGMITATLLLWVL